MRPLAIALLSSVGALAICGSLAFTTSARQVSSPPPVTPNRPLPQDEPSARPPGSTPILTSVPPSAFARLPSLRFVNESSRQSAEVRLYDDSGQVSELEASRLDGLLCDTRDPRHWAALPLNRRTLQLVVRAALHFQVEAVQVVSAYRKPGRRREGPHANGSAIDFKLPGVNARRLAAYLRTLPRVGVGIYTHPKTAFVHLDDREHSFHWLDASPPGRRWRERSLGGTGLAQRDAEYRRAGDWPEGMSAPEPAGS